MTRTEHVATHVSKAKKQRLQREADEAGLTLSAYLDSIIDQYWAQVDGEQAADRLNAEEKIERIVDQATQELEATARHTEQRVDDLAEMMARSGTYSVANFELLKYQHGPPEGTKTDALRVGSRRLRAPLSEHPDLLDLDSDGDQEDDTDPLTVEDAENSDDEDDDLSVTDRFFKGRGRSDEEAERTRW